ncbi:hypothetical protein Sjap_013659 [Stephania japonica]|uniref:Uncharacterized protein n=1 Tax=Stephania japonica TaxID=461633 RepID=A0AAP0NXV9_9MAGN
MTMKEMQMRAITKTIAQLRKSASGSEEEYSTVVGGSGGGGDMGKRNTDFLDDGGNCGSGDGKIFLLSMSIVVGGLM